MTSQWHDAEGERARRYYFITDDGREHLAAFRAEWGVFAKHGRRRDRQHRSDREAAMSTTVLEHPLVRDYLRRLNAACIPLPVAQARELRDQIVAHLDEALPPDAGDEEVAAELGRLGAPAALAAEAAGGAIDPLARAPGLRLCAGCPGCAGRRGRRSRWRSRCWPAR